nr:hypothetical protein [Tanacetum cinerariifolium]
MAKQKIVVRVTMNTDKKSRKALGIAVSLNGVESASFVGSDQIAVTGEGVDSVKLATLLRKGVGYTELVTVGNVEDKKPEVKETKPAEGTWQIHPYEYNYYNCYGIPYYYYLSSVSSRITVIVSTDRLQKLISQLEILEESLSQEDINLKFLRSLPTEWRIHTLIWRNKIDLEEQSLDDLFNSLKIHEGEGEKLRMSEKVYIEESLIDFEETEEGRRLQILWNEAS